MAVTPGDVYQLKLYCKLTPQFGITIRHFILATMTNQASEQGLCDALSALFGPLFKQLIGSTASYYGALTGKLVGNVFDTQAHSVSGAGIGTAAGANMPAQVSGLISLRTGIPGRKFRGRAYVPFMADSENTVTGGFPVPSAGTLTTLALLAAKMQTCTVTTADAPASVCTLNGQIYHRATGTFSGISQTIAVPNWATQKRRGAFGRTNQNPF